MKHLSESQLILYYYRETQELVPVTEHLEACSDCHSRYRELERQLALMKAAAVPVRGDDYESQVWMKLKPKLAGNSVAGRRSIPHFQKWWLAAAAMLLIATFLAGKYWRTSPSRLPELVPVAVMDRMLLVKVADHLERTQLALLELVHGEEEAALEISNETALARDLVAANRLYRQSASLAGETDLAAVLDELERVLLEVANRPSQSSASDLQQIRRRIKEKGILFKVRVLGSEVRFRGRQRVQESL
jgi:hypothetical protein